MNRPVYVLNILPRENRHHRDRPILDVLDVVGVGLLAGIGYVILVLVLA